MRLFFRLFLFLVSSVMVVTPVLTLIQGSRLVYMASIGAPLFHLKTSRQVLKFLSFMIENYCLTTYLQFSKDDHIDDLYCSALKCVKQSFSGTVRTGVKH